MYFSSNKHAVLLISTLFCYSLPFSKLQLYVLYSALCYSTLYSNVLFPQINIFSPIDFFMYLTILAAKLPPRVNQTAHWMSCAQLYKTLGYHRALVIFLLQAVFGTIDEVMSVSC